MAFNNPAFDNPTFRDNGKQYREDSLNNYQNTATAQAGVNIAQQAQMEGAYAAPSAGSAETGRMTVTDTVKKTVVLFAILVATAIAGWAWSMAGVSIINQPDGSQLWSAVPSMAPWIIGAIGGFVLALVVIFGSRKKVRPPLIFLYAAFQGLFIGGLSAYFEFVYPGIVMQATLATLSVIGVTLALFASGKIRASKKATKVFMIALIGYAVFSLINVILMLTGATGGNAFGLFGASLFGWLPLGLVIGVVVVIMAAYSLVLDFDSIQQGVRNGAPRIMGWMGAFGIMVTVVWLYTELLRMLAILRGNN